MSPTFCVVFITVPDETVAKALARGLVEQHHAACVNIVPGITSIYRWEGTLHEDAECMLVCKSTEAAWDALVQWVQAHHPYTTPEIIRLPLTAGSPAYLDWIMQTLAESRQGELQ